MGGNEWLFQYSISLLKKRNNMSMMSQTEILTIGNI